MLKIEFDKIDEIIFNNSIFVLTGDFCIGSKELIESLIVENGGHCKTKLVKNTKYLVVGNLGSTKWTYGSFGGLKLEEAKGLQNKGSEIKIISEDRLVDQLLLNIKSAGADSFIYIASDDGVIIQKYIGRDTIVRIPEEIDGKPVIKIDDSTFDESSKYHYLKIVLISENINSIGKKAFYQCKELSYVCFHEGLEIIEDKAFEGCVALKSLNIPKTVKAIGKDVFLNCYQLRYVTVNYDQIDNGIKKMIIKTFEKEDMTTNLMEIVQYLKERDINNKTLNLFIKVDDNSSSSIFSYLVGRNKSYQGVCFDFEKYDGELMSIRSKFFKPLMVFSRLLEPINLNEKTRDNYAKYLANNCVELFTEMKLISGLEVIAEYNAINSKNIDEWIEATIECGFTEGTAFLMNYKTTNIPPVDIFKNIERELMLDPLSAKVMKKEWKFTKNKDNTYTIRGYKGMDSEIEIPKVIGSNLVTIIGERGFENNSIEEVTIPDTIKRIESYAFVGCLRLKNVKLSENIQHIGAHAFSGCHDLRKFTKIPHDNSKNACHLIEDGIIYNAKGDALVCFPRGRVGEYKLPNNIKCIRAGALSECESLTNIEMNDCLMNIEESAFYYCHTLTSIHIPASVRNIGKGAFALCVNLHSIQLPEGITSIRNDTFNSCYKLLSITIPNSVTEIKATAFFNCKWLHHIELPENLTRIGDYAFSKCGKLRNIVIPGSVKQIGKCAFEYCNNLNEVDIQNGVVEIGNQAFANCYNLDMLKIPKSVESIGKEAFSCLTCVIVDSDSYAHKFAIKNKIKFKIIE